jgi:hypothetical protein
MAVFKGNTSGGQEIARAQQAADAPFLPAAFWKPKVKLAFVVVSTHKSSNGPYIGVRLVKPERVTIDGKEHEHVRIGNLAGITLARLKALEKADKKYFLVGDKVYLECVGITPPEKEGYSPSPNFEIEIDRQETAAT